MRADKTRTWREPGLSGHARADHHLHRRGKALAKRKTCAMQLEERRLGADDSKAAVAVAERQRDRLRDQSVFTHLGKRGHEEHGQQRAQRPRAQVSPEQAHGAHAGASSLPRAPRVTRSASIDTLGAGTTTCIPRIEESSDTQRQRRENPPS
jgi:hypothetical protein